MLSPDLTGSRQNDWALLAQIKHSANPAYVLQSGFAAKDDGRCYRALIQSLRLSGRIYFKIGALHPCPHSGMVLFFPGDFLTYDRQNLENVRMVSFYIH